MKKYLVKVLAALGFSAITMSAHAGMPVIDIAAIVNLVLSYTTEYEALSQDYAAYARQFEQLKTAANQLKAMKDSRDMGALIDTDSLRQLQPSQSYIDIRSLGGSAQSSAAHKATLDAVIKRVTMLQALTDAIDNPDNDAKASADLNSRIAAENARLQNEQIAAFASKEYQESKGREQYYIDRDIGTAKLNGPRGLKMVPSH